MTLKTSSGMNVLGEALEVHRITGGGIFDSLYKHELN